MKEKRTCVICRDIFSTKNTSNKKTCDTECSRKYRDVYCKEYYNRPDIKTKIKEYNQRLDVKARQKEYNKKYRQKLNLKNEVLRI